MSDSCEIFFKILFISPQGSPSKSAHSTRSRRSRHATPRRGPTPGLARAQSTESNLAMIGTNGGSSVKAGVKEDLEDLDGLEFTMNSNGNI